MTEKAHGCYGCMARCDASNRHVTPIWRNVYCEDDSDCRSLTKKNDDRAPKWCPRDIKVGKTMIEIVVTRRSTDNNRYRAQIKDIPGYWAAGGTAFAAIGDLVASHSEKFDVKIIRDDVTTVACDKKRMDNRIKRVVEER